MEIDLCVTANRAITANLGEGDDGMSRTSSVYDIPFIWCHQPHGFGGAADVEMQRTGSGFSIISIQFAFRWAKAS